VLLVGEACRKLGEEGLVLVALVERVEGLLALLGEGDDFLEVLRDVLEGWKLGLLLGLGAGSIRAAAGGRSGRLRGAEARGERQHEGERREGDKRFSIRHETLPRRTRTKCANAKPELR
jgi:hypothetical protein